MKAAPFAVLLVMVLAAMPASAQNVEASTAISDLDILRHNAGTTDIRYDDVIVLDVSNDGQINIGDLVLSGEYNNAYPGAYVTDQMNALIGAGTELQAYVVYADVDGNSAYGSGDYVFLSSDADSLPTSSSSSTEFTLRLTNTDEGTFGTLARTPDDDRQAWNDDVSNDLGGGANAAAFTYVDANDDGDFDSGETAYLVPSSTTDGQSLPANAIQLTRAAPSGTTTTSTTTSTTQTTGTTTTITTTETRTMTTTFTETVSQVSTMTVTVTATETAAPTDQDTPAFAALSLATILLVGVFLIRRRLD